MKFLVTLFSALCLTQCGREARNQDEKTETPPLAPTQEPKPEDACLRLKNEGFLATINGNWYVSLKWETGPAVSPTETTAKIFIADKNCLPNLSNVATVVAKPWMSVHGHGAPTNKLVVTRTDNDFSMKGLYFIMPGPWELTLEVTDLTGTKDTVEFKVTVP